MCSYLGHDVVMLWARVRRSGVEQDTEQYYACNILQYWTHGFGPWVIWKYELLGHKIIM